MKNLHLLTIALLLLVTACKKENIAKQSEYDASYKAWISFKNSSKNSYSYTTTFGSWVGFGVTIKVAVSNGKIVSRDYVKIQSRNDGTNKADTVKTWHEDAATINSHPNDAADALTIDDIYLKARTEWLKADAATNDIIFEAKNHGLISDCGYVLRNCADDCFRGISITAITAL
jgi:PKD repeat protein